MEDAFAVLAESVAIATGGAGVADGGAPPLRSTGVRPGIWAKQMAPQSDKHKTSVKRTVPARISNPAQKFFENANTARDSVNEERQILKRVFHRGPIR